LAGDGFSAAAFCSEKLTWWLLSLAQVLIYCITMSFQATGKVWAKIPDSDSATVGRAVQAAKDAFVTW